MLNYCILALIVAPGSTVNITCMKL